MKNRYILAADIPLIAIAAFGAFAGRFDLLFYSERPEFMPFLIAAITIKPIVFAALGMYQRYWRYASVGELTVVVLSVSAASTVMALLAAAGTILHILPIGFSRIVLFNDWLLTVVLTGGIRLGVRVVHESLHRRDSDEATKAQRDVLIIGAGAAGTMVVKEMHRNPQLGLRPVGFLDDDPAKVGKQITGVRVLGRTSQVAQMTKAHKVDSVIIAMPTAEGPIVRAVLEACRQAGVKSLIMPGVFELLDGQVSVNRLRSIKIEDLLRRNPVANRGTAAASVAGQVVLITGAGGSIGFELARQIAGAGPSALILLGHGENSIFDAEANLRTAFPSLRLSTVIADIRDRARLAQVFDRLHPNLVFHAAAHKHVPLMEDNPEEAVTNNVVGTQNVVNEALRVGTQRFVLISTDKAVMPTSIMGATKRLAEAIVMRAGRQSARSFVVVRFGNVLGSRGSVVNTFKAQIARGGPVTVTHPEMTRYFMTIPEAVHLVLLASGIGKGGELFVLEMGDPVRIVDLAKDLIKLSGFAEDDIPIAYTGVRAGEKMEEALFEPDLQTRSTSHAEVMQVIGTEAAALEDLDNVIDHLAEAAAAGDRETILAILARRVPGFAGRAPGAAKVRSITEVPRTYPHRSL
jgi:FlaA1/EpsC-like NDP-sugar epimerase